MNTTNLDLSTWLAIYKSTASQRRAARHQAARRPRPPRPAPARPEPRFVGSHVARLRAMGAAHPTPRRGLGSFPRGKGIT